MSRHLKSSAGIALYVLDESFQGVGGVIGEDGTIKGKIESRTVEYERQGATAVVHSDPGGSIGAIISVVRHTIAVTIGFNHRWDGFIYNGISCRCGHLLLTNHIPKTCTGACGQHNCTGTTRCETDSEAGRSSAQGTEIVIIGGSGGAPGQKKRKKCSYYQPFANTH